MNALPLTRESFIGEWTVWANRGDRRLGQLVLRLDFTYVNSLHAPVAGRHWGHWSLSDCGESQFIRFDLEGAEPQQHAGLKNSEPILWPEFVVSMILGGNARCVNTPHELWTRVEGVTGIAMETVSTEPEPAAPLLVPTRIDGIGLAPPTVRVAPFAHVQNDPASDDPRSFSRPSQGATPHSTMATKP